MIFFPLAGSFQGANKTHLPRIPLLTWQGFSSLARSVRPGTPTWSLGRSHSRRQQKSLAPLKTERRFIEHSHTYPTLSDYMLLSNWMSRPLEFHWHFFAAQVLEENTMWIHSQAGISAGHCDSNMPRAQTCGGWCQWHRRVTVLYRGKWTVFFGSFGRKSELPEKC